MRQKRFTELQTEVQNALTRLQEAVTQPETPILRDAVSQRFEFTFELTWKTLQLYLEHRGLGCGSPRATIKKTFSEGVIPTLEEADVWLQMLDDRNLTSHADDEELAQRIYQHIVQTYTPLLKRMAERVQALSWD